MISCCLKKYKFGCNIGREKIVFFSRYRPLKPKKLKTQAGVYVFWKMSYITKTFSLIFYLLVKMKNDNEVS